jgi:hypothetical protein
MPRGESGFSNNWEEIFNRYNIVQRVEREGYADLTAAELKAIYEPRLLTKVDHSHQLPTVMKNHGLSILTLSASTWRVGPFNIFQTLPEWKTPDHTVASRSLPSWLESLSLEGLTGEGAVMNAAAASGMLDEFCGEELVSTITGKGRSGDFSFTVDGGPNGKTNIDVRGAQIEIDAGFEGRTGLFLFEAKKHRAIDFNVRQLYYPFRAWNQRVRKPIRPVFLTFANGVFDLTEYRFTDPNNFSSSEIVSHSRFMLGAGLPKEEEIVQAAKSAKIQPTQRVQPPKDIPFPQADDFERIIDLVEFLADSPRTLEDITSEYEFAPRQSDYYFNAARYLGLAEVVRGEDGKNYRQATALAEEIIKLPYRQRQVRLAELILAIDPISEIYLNWVSKGETPHLDKVEELFTKSESSNGLSGATLRRRAQTISAWVGWLKSFDD